MTNITEERQGFSLISSIILCFITFETYPIIDTQTYLITYALMVCVMLSLNQAFLTLSPLIINQKSQDITQKFYNENLK